MEVERAAEAFRTRGSIAVDAPNREASAWILTRLCYPVGYTLDLVPNLGAGHGSNLMRQSVGVSTDCPVLPKRLDGGPGRDILYGNEGRDFLATRDNHRGNDIARGGPGDDDCETDRGDVRSSC